MNNEQYVRDKYISSLDMFYNDFINNIQDWRKIENRHLTIVSHTITFDDVELSNEIKVSFYRIACYSNLAIQEYVNNKYNELGIFNFFKNIKDIIGNIDFMDLEKLNRCRVFIYENTRDLIEYTNELYEKLRNSTFHEQVSYDKALNWFTCVTSILQSIVNTVISALKSFIVEDEKPDMIDVTQVREGKGWKINEIPSIIDNYNKLN